MILFMTSSLLLLPLINPTNKLPSCCSVSFWGIGAYTGSTACTLISKSPVPVFGESFRRYNPIEELRRQHKKAIWLPVAKQVLSNPIIPLLSYENRIIEPILFHIIFGLLKSST